MERLGLRPAQLAIGLDRAPSEISFILSGTRKISPGIMLDLHEKYRIALPYMRRGEGPVIDSTESLLSDRENVIIEWCRRDNRNQEILFRMVQSILDLDRKNQRTRTARKKKKKEKSRR